MPEEPLPAETPLVSSPQEEGLEDCIALCLSGGGYRAMLFHLGSLWYLHDARLLERLARVSSVSGGSITAGVLALHWRDLAAGDRAAAFRTAVVEPLRRMASTTVDVGSVLGGLFGRGSINDRIIKRYRQLLFGDRTLQDFPDQPRFVVNATNLQTGSLVRFSKPYIADWQVGRQLNPTLGVAEAVAASSAFPPVLSPARLRFDEGAFDTDPGPLHRPPFTTNMFLCDGGVYDNLGIETAWKRCRTILVSDAGGRLQPVEDPHADPLRQGLRIEAVTDNQVRSLRKRQVVDAFKKGVRKGAYWGAWTDPDDYRAASRLSLPKDRAGELARVPTRLEAMPDELQERLIDFGYGMAERAVRSFYDPAAFAATAFPYPRGI